MSDNEGPRRSFWTLTDKLPFVDNLKSAVVDASVDRAHDHVSRGNLALVVRCLHDELGELVGYDQSLLAGLERLETDVVVYWLHPRWRLIRVLLLVETRENSHLSE